MRLGVRRMHGRAGSLQEFHWMRRPPSLSPPTRLKEGRKQRGRREGIRGCFRREPPIFSMVMSEHKSDATVLLTAVERGEPKAADELLELVYQELRQLATRKMAQESPGQTLQPTALVHEAWLRLVGAQNPTFKDRTHFFRAAAEGMRHILIDRARRRRTRRHGGGHKRVDLDECDLVAPQADDQLLA